MRRIFITIMVALAAIAVAAGFAVAGGVQSVRLALPISQAQPLALATPAAKPTVPGLPINTAGMRSTAVKSRVVAFTRGHLNPLLKRPPVPSLQTALRAVAGHRRTMSASGAAIVMIGKATIPEVNPITYYWSGTVQYGDQNETLECYGLAASTKYSYVVFAPNTVAYQTAQFTTDTSGNCGATADEYVVPDFALPFNGTSVPSPANAASSGVWTVAMLNATTGNYDSIVYIVVVGGQPLSITSDQGGTTPSSQFAPGATVYVNASNLTSDNYALGFVYNSAKVSCVYTLPNGPAVPYGGPCFGNGKTIPGVAANGGNIAFQWPSGSAATGTYSATLTDTTTNTVVGQQQFSISPSNVAWTLTPYGTGGTPAGTNVNNTFAFDGSSDQSVSAVNFSATGLTGYNAGDQLTLTLSDSTGTALNALSELESTTSSTATVTASAAPNFGKITFPLKSLRTTTAQAAPINLQLAQPVDLFGPTVATFSSPVMTAQIYDKTSSAVLASESFDLLAYTSRFAWPSAVGSTLTVGTGGTTSTVTISNPGLTSYGPQTYDGIKGFEIAADANGETLTYTGPAQVNDSSGNVWNVSFSTAVDANGEITVTPAVTGVSLPAGATLNISTTVTVAAPTTKCGPGACALTTSILPLHGISWSTMDAVTNTLPITSASATSQVSGTFGWTAVTAAPTPLPIPKVLQSMYLQGTDGTAAGTTYTLKLILTNTSTAATPISQLEITLPPSFNATGVAISSFTTGGTGACTATPCNWVIGAANAVDSTAPPNAINLWDSAAAGGGANPGDTIAANGGTATIILTFPMWTTSAAFTGTTILANQDGGCPAAAKAYCTINYTSFNLTKNGTTASLVMPNGTSIDSTEIGVYSLNPSLMTAAFNPSTIPSGTTSTVWQFTNTSTSQDANPDYIDRFLLTFQSTNDMPSSITPPTGWTATKVSTTEWIIALCGAVNTTSPYTCTNGGPTQTQETNYAIAPGGSFSATINFNGSEATGNYTTNTWQVEGSNGQGLSTVANVDLDINNTSATVAFIDAGGYGAAPPTGLTAVGAGAEPTVGADTNTTYGNGFGYQITNNGLTSITSFQIVVPYQNRYYVTGATSVSPDVFDLTSTPTVVLSNGASGTCTVTDSSSTTSGTGLISVTGCTIPTNGVATVYMNMKAPYSIGSEFIFNTWLNGSPTTGTEATPKYATANYLDIVLNSTLTLTTPTTLGSWTGPGGESSTAACSAGTTCTFTPSSATVSLGSLAGLAPNTFTATNAVAASVTSDASGSDGWILYLSTTNNPISTGQTVGVMTSSSSNTSANFTLNSSYSSAYSSITSANMQLSSFSGASSPVRGALDTLQDFQLTLASGATAGSQNMLLTYTLITN